MTRRLIGSQRCEVCGGVQRASYRTDVSLACECSYCGSLAAEPEGPQFDASALAPKAVADAEIADFLEDQHAAAVLAARAQTARAH